MRAPATRRPGRENDGRYHAAMVEGLTVEVAGPADLGLILHILRSASAGASAGTGRYAPEAVSWGHNFPDVGRDLPAGLVHLARLHGRPVGTFVLCWSDEPVWGADDDEAGYLHRLASHPDAAGQGIGHALIGVASSLVRKRGRKVLRLDCDPANDRLRAYYEAQGFSHAGDVDRVPRTSRPGFRSASRYQRPADWAPASPDNPEVRVDP
jgi:GNAT superfamily N-acetyltransferase